MCCFLHSACEMGCDEYSAGPYENVWGYIFCNHFFFYVMILLSVSHSLDGCRGHKQQLVWDDHLNASE